MTGSMFLQTKSVLERHGAHLTDRQIRSIVRSKEMTQQELEMMIAIDGITLGEIRTTLHELETHELVARRKP
jgi:hypothetical protein